MKFHSKIAVNLILLINAFLGVHAEDDLAPDHQYVGIFGGEPASIEDFPYMVSLRKNGSHFCGGSIVSDRYVLTAAHCVKDKPSSLYSVLVGTTDLRVGGERFDIENIVDHPSYATKKDYDISLMKINGIFRFDKNVAVAQLPDNATRFTEGILFNITGWGYTELGPSLPNTLVRAVVPYVSSRICRYNYRDIANVTRRTICAGSSGHDACWGDSGGPLTLDGMVVGITSKGRYCGLPQYPTLYTKVSRFRTWIKKVTRRTEK